MDQEVLEKMDGTHLDTLPKYFLASVEKYGDRKVAIRQKEYGVWHEYTWQDSYENVRDFALGLVSLGLQPSERVTIVSDNDRQYLWADIAIMAVGSASVGMFTDAISSEVEYIISHSDATFALAKDQEQVDKLLEIKANLPGVKKVIYWDGRGMWAYDDDWLMSFDAVQALGRQLDKEQPGLFDKMVAAGGGEDICNLCYTSGTTGVPKGAMISYANFIAAKNASANAEPRSDTDNIVSFAPLAWIAEHTLAVTPHIIDGLIVNFPEEPETVQQNIREISPEIVFYPARLWENLTATIQVRINDSSRLNRWLYNLFLPVGYKVADRHYAKQPVGPLLTLLNWLGNVLVFKPLRSQVGLVRVRSALTAGAALSDDMLRYFRALGLNLKQIYASTETTAAGTQHYEDDVKFGSVGTPHTDVKMSVDENGEIWLGGPSIFQGYYKNEEETAKAIVVDDEGIRWFRSGDAGYIDEDGHLIYLDRMKDMIELANGERYSPQFVEGRLKFSPYIRDAMSIGNTNSDYVTAIISIDFGNVGRWAEKNRMTYTTFVDLSQKEEVYDLIRGDIERVNERLPTGARVRKFVLLHKEFDADEAEMTRTRKLRRGFLAERYDDMIESMYNGKQSVKVSAAVRYRDGRESIVETDVRIMSLDGETVTT